MAAKGASRLHLSSVNVLGTFLSQGPGIQEGHGTPSPEGLALSCEVQKGQGTGCWVGRTGALGPPHQPLSLAAHCPQLMRARRHQAIGGLLVPGPS